MEKIPVIFDCDPGVDDALAIILALTHPGIDVKAVCTVSGNGNLENTTRNGLKILTLCGREDIPLYKGAATALNGVEPDTVSAFGDDGMGGYADEIPSDKRPEAEDAADFLADIVNKHPHELTIMAIGPCTNIAKAIRKNPDFPKLVKRIIVMGGAKYTGNTSPVAEYNFWADPQAAKEVYEAPFSENVMIGLDITNQIALSGNMREILRNFNTPLSLFLYNITRIGLDENWQSRRKPVAPMHDVLTTAYIIDNSILELKKANIEIATEGIAAGQSLVDIGGHWNNGVCNAYYGAAVDVAKFYKLLLTTIFPEQSDAVMAYLGASVGQPGI